MRGDRDRGPRTLDGRRNRLGLLASVEASVVRRDFLPKEEIRKLDELRNLSTRSAAGQFTPAALARRRVAYASAISTRPLLM